MRPTGHRIKYSKVDAEPGRRWDQRGYRQGLQGRHRHLQEVTKDELENVALESTRTIEIDEFARRDEIDSRYNIRPYYLAPEGKVGHDGSTVIRETIRSMDMVAIGRLVLTNREQIISLEPLGKRLMGDQASLRLAECQQFVPGRSWRLRPFLTWRQLLQSHFCKRVVGGDNCFFCTLHHNQARLHAPMAVIAMRWRSRRTTLPSASRLSATSNFRVDRVHKSLREIGHMVRPSAATIF
jgi:Ku70/Ku80 beta-barrel domain